MASAIDSVRFMPESGHENPPGAVQLRSIVALLGNDPSPQWLFLRSTLLQGKCFGSRTNVKKRSAAQADLFSGVKRLKENVDHLGSARGDTDKRKNSAR